MDNLNNVADIMHTLVKSMKLIHSQMDFIMKSPDTLNQINDNILVLQDTYEKFKDIAPSIETIFPIAHLHGLFGNSMSKLWNFIKVSDIANETGASQTYILDTISSINDASDTYARYVNDPTMSNMYLSMMDQLSKLQPEDIKSQYAQYPYSHILYSQWIQHMLDSELHERDQIISILDDAKTKAVVDGALQMDLNMNMDQLTPHNFPVQRFGLMPVKQSLSVSELSCLYFGTCNSTKLHTIDEFIKLSRSRRTNVIAMFMVTPTPTAFTISKLYDPKEYADLVDPPSSGINDNTMERFNLIKFMNSSDETIPHFYNIKQFKVCSASKQWIIIRTLDGSNWDAMYNKVVHDDITANSLTVSDELASRIMRGASPRIKAIQSIKNALFSKHFITPKDIGSEIKYDNKTLINDLINIITGRIIDYVDKSLVPLPTSKLELENAIRDPMFVEIMNQEILASYLRTGVDTRFRAHKLIGSFVSDVDNSIVPQFSRALKMNMIEMGPKKKIFREHDETILRTRIYNIFVSIIKKSVNSTIRSKENIYEKLLIKNRLLKEMGEYV